MAKATEKKTPAKGRKGWSEATLLKHLNQFIKDEGIKGDEPITTVITALEQAIVKQATA